MNLTEPVLHTYRAILQELVLTHPTEYHSVLPIATPRLVTIAQVHHPALRVVCYSSKQAKLTGTSLTHTASAPTDAFSMACWALQESSMETNVGVVI